MGELGCLGRGMNNAVFPCGVDLQGAASGEGAQVSVLKKQATLQWVLGILSSLEVFSGSTFP